MNTKAVADAIKWEYLENDNIDEKAHEQAVAELRKQGIELGKDQYVCWEIEIKHVRITDS